MPTDFTIVAGTTGNFSAVLTPPNGAQAAGTTPQWTASDPSVALQPSGDGLKVVAAVPAAFASQTFDLTLSAQSADPAVGTVTKTHTITVTPAPLQSVDFGQDS